MQQCPIAQVSADRDRDHLRWEPEPGKRRPLDVRTDSSRSTHLANVPAAQTGARAIYIGSLTPKKREPLPHRPAPSPVDLPRRRSPSYSSARATSALPLMRSSLSSFGASSPSIREGSKI